MPMTLKKIENEALNLTLDARAALVGKLLMSLEEPTSSELEKIWLDEAEKRLDDYRSGRTQGIHGNEVFNKAIAELS